MSTDVYLVRHGKSIGNIEGIFQGQLDFELSDLGKSQAKQLVDKLPKDIDWVYSSPLKRAVETAKIAIPHKASHIRLDNRLMERNLGILQGERRSNVSTEFLNLWYKAKGELNFDGLQGETLSKMIMRVSEFHEDLQMEIKKYNPKTVVVFTHFGVLSITYNRLLHIKKEYFANAEVNILKYNESEFGK